MITIKFKKAYFQLNSQYFTTEDVRDFMNLNNSTSHVAIRHNINFYQLTENNMLVHVYDAYEVNSK